MRRNLWLPGDPFDDNPLEPWLPSKITEDWVPIAGMARDETLRRHNQLILAGRGKHFLADLKKGDGLHRQIGDHLGLAPGDWRERRRFFKGFVSLFLKLYKDQSVTIQVIPRRIGFRSVIGRQPIEKSKMPTRSETKSGYFQNPSSGVITINKNIYKPAPSRQTVLDVRQIPTGLIRDKTSLNIGYGLRIPTADLRLASADEFADPPERAGELSLLQVAVRRVIPGTAINVEAWFFMGRKGEDEQKILKTGRIPVLEHHFRELHGVQEAPIIMMTALEPDGKNLQTHSINVDPRNGQVLDIRQSRPTLQHHFSSGSHNFHSLMRLAHGKYWLSRWRDCENPFN